MAATGERLGLAACVAPRGLEGLRLFLRLGASESEAAEKSDPCGAKGGQVGFLRHLALPLPFSLEDCDG